MLLFRCFSYVIQFVYSSNAAIYGRGSVSKLFALRWSNDCHEVVVLHIEVVVVYSEVVVLYSEVVVLYSEVVVLTFIEV